MCFYPRVNYLACRRSLFAEGIKIKHLLLSAHYAQHCEDNVSKEDITEEDISKMCLCSESTENQNGEMAKQIGNNKLYN